MGISTHILDTAKGKPAAGVPVRLSFVGQEKSSAGVVDGVTDTDGRCRLLQDEPAQGIYTLRFETAMYYAQHGMEGLYPYVEVTFSVVPGQVHYHIPLLLTANGYTTYRGS